VEHKIRILGGTQQKKIALNHPRHIIIQCIHVIIKINSNGNNRIKLQYAFQLSTICLHILQYNILLKRVKYFLELIIVYLFFILTWFTFDFFWIFKKKTIPYFLVTFFCCFFLVVIVWAILVDIVLRKLSNNLGK
jgi:hypothetical protein